MVKLTPHEKFFFGGAKTFGEGDETNYFVQSNYFPQQTALLGFIRHQLLIQGGANIFEYNKIQDKSLATELIGAHSFCIDSPFPYGKIHSLSPIFIAKKEKEEKEEDYFFPANKEYQIDEKINDDCTEEKIGSFHEIEKRGDHFVLNGFNPKYKHPDLLINIKLEKKQYEDIFKEKKQVGIRKNYEGKTEENAYYIQIFYKLENDYSFAFIVELEENVTFISQDVVTFGGEQQTFKMEVSDFSADFESLIPDYEKSKNFDKIVLVSDAMVSNDVFKECVFAITDTVNFEFLKTKANEAHNYSNSKKSKKYNLFKRGSVFYGNISQIETCLNNPQLEKLGYNIYKPIKK